MTDIKTYTKRLTMDIRLTRHDGQLLTSAMPYAGDLWIEKNVVNCTRHSADRYAQY